MQAINFLTHLILDLLSWTALGKRPFPSHLVEPLRIELSPHRLQRHARTIYAKVPYSLSIG